MTEPLTVRALIAAYRSDPDSKYCKPEDEGGLRYVTKSNYDSLMRRLEQTRLPAPNAVDLADTKIADINARLMLRLHTHWLASGVDMAHALVGMLRGLITFGATLLECADCRALKVTLHDMRFKMGKPRKVYLTAEQANAVRAHARLIGLDSLALAQAIQFECAFRQKDVIGEWVPSSVNRIPSDVTARGMKWLRGIRWEYIGDDLVLRHVTSKKSKDSEPDLKLAPMVLDELARAYPGVVVSDAEYDEQEGTIIKEMVVDRSKLPASGPIIVFEETGRPYRTHKFRRTWRDIANALAIPKNVQNRDTRSGKITEVTNYDPAGLENAQHMAGHSDISTTQIYARAKAKKASKAMLACVVGRKRDAALKPKLLPYYPEAVADADGR